MSQERLLAHDAELFTQRLVSQLSSLRVSTVRIIRIAGALVHSYISLALNLGLGLHLLSLPLRVGLRSPGSGLSVARNLRPLVNKRHLWRRAIKVQSELTTDRLLQV